MFLSSFNLFKQVHDSFLRYTDPRFFSIRWANILVLISSIPTHSLHSVSLTRPCLSICKYSGMIALYYLFDHAWDSKSIINLLLLWNRFKDLIKLKVSSLLNVFRVIIDIDDWARDVSDNLFRVSIFMRHQGPHSDCNPDPGWLLLHHYNNIFTKLLLKLFKHKNQSYSHTN